MVPKINGGNKSGVFLVEKNFTDYLSNVKRDHATGRIIGAEATIIRWLGKQNSSRALSDPVKGRGEPIDKDTFEFEGKMIQVMLNATSRSAGFQSFPNVNRSFGDIASSTILGDVGVMAIGKLINQLFTLNLIELRTSTPSYLNFPAFFYRLYDCVCLCNSNAWQV